jgi:hypothetical protein
MADDSLRLGPNFATEWLAFLLRIRIFPRSDLGPKTSYPDWGLSWFSLVLPCRQGRIKGFVGPRQFSFLGPFGDSKSIAGSTVCSRLYGLVKGRDTRIIEKHG